MTFLDTQIIHPETLKSLPIRDWLKKTPLSPMTVKSRLRKLYAMHGTDYTPQYDDLFKPVAEPKPKEPKKPKLKPMPMCQIETVENPVNQTETEIINGMNIFDVLVPHAPTMQQFELHKTHFGLTPAETLLQFMKWGAEASRYHIVADEQARETELREALETIQASIILNDPKALQSDDSSDDDDFFNQYEKPPIVPPLAPNALHADDWDDLINQELGF